MEIDRSTAGLVVIDTHYVLDLLVYEDSAARPLADALAAGRLRWISCGPMRDELARVLGYPAIARRLVRLERTPDHVLAAHDRAVFRRHERPASAGPRCSDPDDQVFVDLALAHGAWLLSRDRAVLALRRVLAGKGVRVSTLAELGVDRVPG